MNENIKGFEVLDEEVWSFSKLLGAAEKCRDLLLEVSEPKANVGLYLPNSVQYIIWYLACRLSGRIAVPIFYGSSDFEVSNTIQACDLQVFVYKEKKEMYRIISRTHQKTTFIEADSLQRTTTSGLLLSSLAHPDTVQK